MGGSFLYVFFQKEEHTALPMGTGNTGGDGQASARRPSSFIINFSFSPLHF